MIRVFIGYDPRETIAYHVLSHGILSLGSVPVSVTPLNLAQLRAIHDRPLPALASTEFSISRFLVPYLCGFEGSAIYMDCDMLLRDDLAALWALRDDRYAVQVVKHHHVPRERTKFLQQPQVAYAMKNWSSLMLFNNQRCKALAPEYVNTQPGLALHRFEWLESLDEIGSLPAGWNHLVGYQAYSPSARIAHFTLGGPYFPGYRECDYAEEWFQARSSMMYAQDSQAMLADA